MIGGPLTDPDVLEHVLAQAGLTPQRSAGQNFLVCEEPLLATLEMLREGPKNVTELGAGLGTLTLALASSDFQVRAIERDVALAALLKKHLTPAQRKKVEIVVDDLRNVDWAPASTKVSVGRQPLSASYSLVGNIPYNLSGWIIRHLTQLPSPPEQVIFLVQREVAERIVAQPPNMSLLGLSAQLWGTATIILTVPASCFWPEPQVDSSLILLTPHPGTGRSLAEREHVLEVAKFCFQAKRKQMGGTLRRVWGADEASSVLGETGISPTARPQELSVKQWQRLAQRKDGKKGSRTIG